MLFKTMALTARLQKSNRPSGRKSLPPHHLHLTQLFIIIILMLPVIYANEPVTNAFASSPLPEMSLLLESVDGSSPESGSVLLGGEMAVSLNLTVASNATLFNSSLNIDFPAEFTPVSDMNVSISEGDNLAISLRNYSFDSYTLRIDFGTIQSATTSVNLTGDDMIMISFNLNLWDSLEDLGDFLSVIAEAEFTSGNRTSQSIIDAIEYAGPGVKVEFQNSGFAESIGTFLLDRETSLNVSFDFPAHNVSNVTIYLELTSADVSSLDVDLMGVAVSADSSYVTYVDPTLPTQLNCIGNTCVMPDLFLGDVYADNGTLTLQISFIIGQTSLVAGDVVFYTVELALNDALILLSAEALTVVEPDLAMTTSIDVLSRTELIADYTFQYMRFTTSVFHTNASTGPAYQVSFYNPVGDLKLDLDTVVPDIYASLGTLILMASKITYNPGVLQVGETAVLSYEARLTQAAVDGNLETNIQLESNLTWASLPASEISTNHPGNSYGPVSQTRSISQVIAYEESLLYNHGLAALFFFIALIVAFVLVVLGCFAYAKMSAGGIYSMVQPEGTIARNVAEHGLIINHRAGKTGLDMVEEYSSFTANESIIMILVQKDKTKKILEFESLDIVGTITTDIQLEEQRTAAMVEMFVMLLGFWALKGGLHKDLSQRLTKKYQRATKDAVKRLDDEYRHDSRELLKHLSQENKGKLIMMKKKHDAEVRLKTAQARRLNNEDLKEVIDLLKKQQATEVASMTQLLRLKQDEEQEKLRKEYATKKRIAVKSLQQEFLDQAILQGKLDEDQARALLMEHHQNTATVERLMDEEMSRQRMMLEEKLARRKLLAKATESQSEHHSLVLNTMATQTMSAISELEGSEQLSREEARAQTERLLKEVRAIKENYERERAKHEESLHKRLSERKKKRMLEKEKENKEELAEFEKGKKSTVENGDMEPEEYLDSKCSLLASHRTQLAEIETEVDEESRQELEKLREEMATKVRSQVAGVRRKLHGDLQHKGLSEKQAKEMMEQHERDVEELMERRQEQKEKQERAIKKRLAKQRKDLAQRKQEEREEREQIREHEEKMVGRLLASQVAMSEEERRRILAEHEQHLVAMENSLALTKLRQRRLLEEKMAVRKSRQMERLAKKQEQEAKRKLRDRNRGGSGDDDDAATPSGLKEMMKKHTEERLAMMAEQDEDGDKLEEEMEAVRSEMLQERANALKDQEDRLGAVMAQLQMEKARELATIEEQQKALLQLKMNMLDELTEKGIMKNAQCKKVIETHQKQVEVLEQKMKKQRAKAEAETKRRLQEKAAERERAMGLRQEEEMQRLLEHERSGTAARLKRVALKHRHIVQMEDFRAKLEIEMAQSLEEIRRQSEVQRLKDQQEQDLEFLSALVKVGRYDRSELINVLHLLFPARSHDQVNQMLTKLYEKVENDGGDSLQGSPVSKKGVAARDRNDRRLEEKVKSAILGQIQESNQRNNSLTKKGKKKKAKKLAPLQRAERGYDGGDNRTAELAAPIRGGAPPLPQISSAYRPEPLGQPASPVYDSDAESYGRRGYDDEGSDGGGAQEGGDYGTYRKGGQMRDTTPPRHRKGKKGGVTY